MTHAGGRPRVDPEAVRILTSHPAAGDGQRREADSK